MRRTLEILLFCIRYRRRGPLAHWPRPGRCHRCGKFRILTNEVPAYCSNDGAYLCERCAIENEEESDWARGYGR